MTAGRLSERLGFYQRATIDDGAGNRRGIWQLAFECAADMSARLGSEAFTAARMEGRVPYSVRIRRNPTSSAVAQGWMALDARAVRYRVVAAAFDPRDRSMLTMTLIADGSLNGDSIAVPAP